MGKNLWFRVIKGFVAFWYCNKDALILILPLFLIADFVLPLEPGSFVRVLGTLVILVFAKVIVGNDIAQENSYMFPTKPGGDFVRDMDMLWRKEEPTWSRPLMLVILFAAFYLLLIRHGALQITISTIINFFS